jgi:glycyl-tRNA synthetase beta chain
MTEMVGEFPELQGIMGRYYALHQGEAAEVAEAIAQHYSPKGPNDPVPESLAGRILALADRIDTLVGFFAISIKPTGSKDPFALRRTALGLLRLAETFPALKLQTFCEDAYQLYTRVFAKRAEKSASQEQVWEDIAAFLWDRLKVYWRERGIRHDSIDAVAEIGKGDSIATLWQRVKALNDFLQRPDRVGEDLLTAYRRACNIVAIEEKKDQRSYDGAVDGILLSQIEERALYQALQTAVIAIKAALQRNAFEEAMIEVAALRPSIDAFFDKVTVNNQDPKVRENRLKLLAYLRTTLQQVADFSKVEG